MKNQSQYDLQAKNRHYKVFCEYKSPKAKFLYSLNLKSLLNAIFIAFFISQAVTGCYINASQGLEVFLGGLFFFFKFWMRFTDINKMFVDMQLE